MLIALLATFVVVGTQVDLLPALTWHDQQRLAQAGFLAGFLVLVAGARDAAITLRAPVLASLAIVALAGAVSATLAPLPRWAWTEWSLLLSLACAVLLVGDLRRRTGPRFDQLLLWFVGATCALFAIRFFGTYAAALAVGTGLDTRELSSLGFSNRRFLGQLQTLTLPLLVLPVLAARNHWHRGAAFLLLGAWWLLAFTSATRGTFFGLAIALPLAAGLSPHPGRRWLGWQAAGVAFGFALYALLFFVFPALAGVDVDLENRLGRLFDSSGRIESWIYTLGIIADHPLLGVGPMHLAYWLNPGVPVAHPHNAFLQIAAEWGVPAALVASGCLAYAFLRYFQRLRRGRTTALATSLAAALVGAAAQSLVDGVIVMPVTQVFLVVIGGWALGIYFTTDRPRDREARITLGRSVVATTFAAVLSMLAITTVRDFGQLEARQERHVAEHGAYLHPRFWQQGWIGLPATQEPAP